MRKLKIILSVFICSLLVFVSCRDDSVDDSYSIFDDSLIKEKTDFEKWLDRYFVKPYNIRVLYNYDDINSNYQFELIPAELEKAKFLSYVARYLWIDTYEEMIDAEFFRMYAPRILQYVGNPGWQNNGAIRLGEAEGGLRIMLYDVNVINLANPFANMQGERDFVKTMHHEYAHIFQQKKKTDIAFDQLTPGAYVGDNCWTVYGNDIAAWRNGLVSRYSGTSFTEDFVEIYAWFVTRTPEWWDNMLVSAATDAEGEPTDAAQIIRKKFEIVYAYYKEWGIDLFELRKIVNRRQVEARTIDLNTVYK